MMLRNATDSGSRRAPTDPDYLHLLQFRWKIEINNAIHIYTSHQFILARISILSSPHLLFTVYKNRLRSFSFAASRRHPKGSTRCAPPKHHRTVRHDGSRESNCIRSHHLDYPPHPRASHIRPINLPSPQIVRI
jgi:hypothetical protein